MRAWVWLLPCWVWRTLFLRAAKQWVQVDGHPRRAFRLDSEFMLIYDPQHAAGVAALGRASASVPAQIVPTAVIPCHSPNADASIKFRNDLRRDLSHFNTVNTALMPHGMITSDRDDGL